MNNVRFNWQRYEFLLALGILLALAFLLYAGSFSHPWLHDDRVVILENPDVRSLGQFLNNHYPGRPLREITYLLDFRLFEYDPAGWHVQNIFWHGLSGGLLFMLLRRLRTSLFVAICAALIFVVHPLQVEVVANVANRKDSLALCFALMSLLAWVRGREGTSARPWWFLAASGAFVLAVLAKEHAVVIPLVVLAWELWLAPPDRRLPWLGWELLAGLVVVPALGFGVWLSLFGGLDWFASRIPWKLGKLNIASDSFADYFRAVFTGWGESFRRIVLPLDLSPEYVYSVPEYWGAARVLGPMGLVAGIVLLLVFCRRRWPLAAFALAWFLLFWLPLSNLLPVGYFVADRYLYAPLAGLTVTGAMLLEHSLSRAWVRWVGLVTVVCLLGGLTWRQDRVWSSPKTLWTQALKVSPDSAVATLNLGDALLREGDQAAAINLFHKTIAINAAAPYPYYNLGVIYEREGDRALAISFFQQFLLRAEASPGSDYQMTAARVRAHLKKRYGLQ